MTRLIDLSGTCGSKHDSKTAVQRQTAVTSYMNNKQLQLSVFRWQYSYNTGEDNVRVTGPGKHPCAVRAHIFARFNMISGYFL